MEYSKRDYKKEDLLNVNKSINAAIEKYNHILELYKKVEEIQET